MREVRSLDSESRFPWSALTVSWIFKCLGSSNAAVVRVLACHQCGPGSIPARCHMWVELVVGSIILALMVFLRVHRFSSKIQFDQDRGPT